MVQRKVYSEADDRYALILVGTRRTKNDLGYPHISVIHCSEEILTKANFSLLEYIEKDLKHAAGPDVESGDWMDAIIVAMDLLHNLTNGRKIRSKRIIALTDLGSPASDDKLEMVIDAVKRDQIEFTFLLPQWDDDSSAEGNTCYDSTKENEKSNILPEEKMLQGEKSKNGTSDDNCSKGQSTTKEKTAVQEAGICLMESIFEASPEAEGCGIEVAQELLFNKERKKKKSAAWKVDLEIGSNIRIPTAGYISIKRENPKSWKRCLAKEDSSTKSHGFDELKAETTIVRNNEDQEVVEPENLIDGFKYGTKVCPISEVEKSAGKYEAGPRSLILIGFVKRAEVPVSLLLGEGCMTFLPQDSDYSRTALSSLVEAMVREEMVAIVRRVYSKNSAPRLAALIPEDGFSVDGDNIRSLVYIELPFAEDLRNYQFPPLWSSSDGDGTKLGKGDPSDSQLKAVDKLIDSMMLSTEEENEDDETDPSTDTRLNPFYQHLYKCLTNRALNPAKGRSLPNVDQRIKDIIEAPEKLANASNKPLTNISQLFKLEIVVQKKEKPTGDKAFKNLPVKTMESGLGSDAAGDASKRLKLSDDSVDLALNTDSIGSSGVTEVGTTTPVEDFEKLLQAGFHINTVSIQMEKVIINLVKGSFGNQMDAKVITCLDSYRQACIDMKSPTVYNKFVRELKSDLLCGLNKRQGIWQHIVERSLGLIDRSICNLATDVSPEDSKAFMTGISEDIPTLTEADQLNDEDVADLLDDL